MVLLPRSLLRESEALDFESEANDFIGGLQQKAADTFASVMPKPAAPPAFQPIDDSIIQQPVEGPAPTPIKPFELPDDASFFGTREAPEPAQSPYSSALTALGADDAAESITKPGGAGYVAPQGGEIESYIRQAAAKRGIDPEIAVKVALSEGGLDDPVRQSDFRQGGKREESYGPFQLYLGGGLGNAALKQGIDPRDPSQWRQSVDFALDQAANGGWGPWYGAARVGIGNRQGLENARAVGVSPRENAPVGTGEGTYSAREGGLTPDQFSSGLSTADAYAACGPAAAVAFARKFGRNPSLQEATNLAKQFGWSPEQGMGRGTAGTVDTANALGAAVKAGPVDDRRIVEDVQRGNPVGINLGGGPGNNGHFLVAERFDPGTGKFDFGNSARALKASGGNTWYTLAELPRLGFGSPRDAIYADAPDSPSPSVVAGSSQKIKGMDANAAVSQYGGLAMEDLSGRDGDQVQAGGTDGGTLGTSPPPRDIRGDYAPRAVEPGDFALSSQAGLDNNQALETAPIPSTRPGGAVEPTPPSGAITEAPASSGNPLLQNQGTNYNTSSANSSNSNPLQQVGELLANAGQAIVGLFAPQKPDLAQGAQDIQARQATLPGTPQAEALAQEPMPLQSLGEAAQRPTLTESVYDPVGQAARGFAGASIETGDRLAELSRKDRMFGGPGLTPEEEAEYVRLFISQYADIGGVSAIRTVPGVIGQAAKPILEEAARRGVPEAAEALAELAGKAKDVAAPVAGIVSRAQADEAAPAVRQPVEVVADELAEAQAQFKKGRLSIGDTYKDAQLPKVEKGVDARGEMMFGYEYSPEAFRISDASGRPIRRYVELPNGAVVHPDELSRLSVDKTTGAVSLAADEGLQIVEAGKRSIRRKYLNDALEEAGGRFTYGASPDDVVTIRTRSGTDVSLPRREWRRIETDITNTPKSDRPTTFSELADFMDTARNATAGTPGGFLPATARSDMPAEMRKTWAEGQQSLVESLRRKIEAFDGDPVYEKQVAKWKEDLAEAEDFLGTLNRRIEATDERDAFARTPLGMSGNPVVQATGRAVGSGAGAAYQESQREGSTPESIAGSFAGAAVSSGARSALGAKYGRRAVGTLSRAVESGDPKRTTAFSPADPNVTYDLEHKVVDLGQLITSHADDFKPNSRFPSELQPRLRDRAAAAQQVQRIANELNPEALLTDTRSIQTGSPIIGPDNIVESGNGRVMALRQALKRNPEAAARYREEIARVAADYGIDPAELRGKKFPVLVRERLSDVDRKAFAREANESSTAVVSGFERSLGDAELLTDDLISGLTVGENQSIDQALSAPGNRGIVRAFTQALPQNEAGTMVDAMGNLSEEGVRRVKQALIIKAYGNSVTGQRMARSMIESIDPGVKNVETAIYGSLPSIARVEAVSKRGDLSISNDIAKAADMYARLKQNGVKVSDYTTQGSMWERETTPIQDALIQVFDANKRSAKRIREVLEGYANRAEPQANPSQQDLFGGDLARASKDEILDAAIRATVGDDVADAAARAADQGLESGRFAQEAADAAGPVSPIEGIPEQQAPRPPTPPIREGLDSGPAGRIPEPRETATATAEGARPPIGPVRIGSDSLQPELPGSEPSRGLYVGEARRRTQKRLDDAMAKGEPITLTDEQEIARLRLDKFPEEMRPWMAEAAGNADWFRTQRRGVVPDVEVQASAAKMWASIDDAIKRGNPGKAYNPEETVALRNLLRGQYEVVQDYAQRLSEPLTKDARDRLVAEQLAEAQKLTALFQVAEGARAEAGRTLRQYREFARSLKDNPEEAGMRYIKARFGSMDGAEKVVATYTQMIQDGASPVELASFLRNVKPRWMDRLNIIRYGAMLSATTTHLRNITGNIINIGQDIGLKPVVAGIDAARAGITGGQRTRYLGETSEMARGMLEGMPTGVRDLWTTLRTGVNPNEIQTIDNLRGGFGSGSGKVDAIVEGPLRALSGADAFFRAVTMGGHSRAVAFRKASQEGLTGTARMDRVQDIVENLHRNLDVLDEASRQSARDILQEDRLATRGVMQMRDGMNNVVPYLGDVVLPFVRTPMNIAAQGIEMSPLGFASVVKDAQAGRVGDATDTAARALFGTALMYGAGTLAMNNMLTGGYPEDAKTRSTLPPGWQPYSLKLGDKYIQYSNLGPFGVPIASAVILAEAKKSGKPIDPGAVVMSMAKYMGDQTFMRGFSDVVKAINEPGRYGEGVLENIGTQLVPFAALGRQIERAMGMAQKDPHGAWEAMQASYPFSAGNVGERLDSRGQPITPSGGLPIPYAAEAFLSPTNISTEKPDQVLSVLRKQGIGIGAPPKSLVTVDGRSVELTPKQKQQFQQLLYSEIQQNLIDFNDPSEAERAMGRARARARESMLLAVR